MYEKKNTDRKDLLKEAQNQAKLRCNGVPLVYDAFEWKESVCMVMEWVKGISLYKLLDLEKRLDIQDKILIATYFIRSLAEVHKLGFVHRDLKPENLLVTPDKGVYLVDFGFSKNITDMQVSSVNTIKGTPAYMAPELWISGNKTDLMRADVYSAGKILEYLLYNTEYIDIVKLLIQTNPHRRPSSAVEVLEIWEKEVKIVSDSSNLKNIVKNLTSLHLSKELLSAARQLLYAHREEEAYWLLVESIEEDGSNSEAIKLLEHFETTKRQKHTKTTYFVFSAAMIFGIVVAFLIGVKYNKFIEVKEVSNKPVLLSTLSKIKESKVVSFRESKIRGNKLRGKLRIIDFLDNYKIYIDSVEINKDTLEEYGASLEPGEHILTIYDVESRLIRKEIIKILPFQIKTISLYTLIKKQKGKN
ncbi:MAG: serine/threonine protein kinase [Chitinispirillaceae bacterium]|nr:serine/threonine protein kinase [Chitinispirillaceae bacterium]